MSWPGLGTAESRWAEERNHPSKAVLGESKAPPKIFRVKHYPPCLPVTCSSPCSTATGARAQQKNRFCCQDKTGLCHPKECVAPPEPGADGHWRVQNDVGGCRGMQMDAKPCRGMHCTGRMLVGALGNQWIQQGFNPEIQNRGLVVPAQTTGTTPAGQGGSHCLGCETGAHVGPSLEVLESHRASLEAVGGG